MCAIDLTKKRQEREYAKTGKKTVLLKLTDESEFYIVQLSDHPDYPVGMEVVVEEVETILEDQYVVILVPRRGIPPEIM